MKKAILLTFLVSLLVSAGLRSQSQFVVANFPKFDLYGDFTSALAAAASGDSIFVPAGYVGSGNPTIDKEVHMIGNGPIGDLSSYFPFLTIRQGADNSSFQGINVGVIYLGGDTQPLSGISFRNCKISTRLQYRYGDSDNISFTECRLTSQFNYHSTVVNATGYTFSKCVFVSNGAVIDFKVYGATITNSVFAVGYQFSLKGGIAGGTTNFVSKCIFPGMNRQWWGSSDPNNGLVNTTFQECLFGVSNAQSVPTGSNTYGSVSTVDVVGDQNINDYFINTTLNAYGGPNVLADADTYTFEIDPTGPASATNFPTGNELGLHGGAEPAIAWGKMLLPRIATANSSAEIDGNGNLILDIEVESINNGN